MATALYPPPPYYRLYKDLLENPKSAPEPPPPIQGRYILLEDQGVRPLYPKGPNVGVAKVKVGELLEKGLGFGASLLNQVVKSQNDKSILKSWKSQVDKPVMLLSNVVVSNALLAVSSPNGNDFGWGRPIAVRTRCSRKYDGKITINPRPIEGSIDIEACLFLETLEAMRDDAKFMKVVTILPAPFKTSV